MGLDFITTCTKTFEKSWDRGRKELAEPSLFTDVASEQRQTFIASPRKDCNFEAGRWYEVAIQDDAAILVDGIDVIGDFVDLPQQVLERVREVGCNAAVAYVHSVHELSGAADVTLR